jgi:uncharacterized membrane protein YbhN (UPF0104 family)
MAPFVETRQLSGGKNASLAIPLQVIRCAVQLGIGVVFVWWIFRWANLDFKHLWLAIRDASLLNLVFAVCFFVCSTALKTIQLQTCLPLSGTKRCAFGLILLQNAFLTILPFRIGEISLPLLLMRSQNLPLTNIVSSILIIRIIDLLVITVTAAVGAVMFGIILSLKTLGISVVVCCILVGAAKLIFKKFMTSKAMQTISLVVACLPNLATLGKISLGSTAVFGFSVLQSAFALQAFGLTIPISEVAFLNAVSFLLAVIPFHPPGGWGTVDLVQVIVLRRLNIQPEVATPVILVTHGFYTVLFFLGGVSGWWLCRRSFRR